MKDLHEPGHVGLVTLIGWLREGRFTIPAFQREFDWGPRDILELMRSIFQDYYIGSLLLWRSTSENLQALSCEPLRGFPPDNADPLDIVLDGQQRLSAMYYAFAAPDLPAPHRRNRYLYFIRVDHFMREDYEEAFEYDWTRRGLNLLADSERQYREHRFPLAVLGDLPFGFSNWAQQYAEYWREQLEQVSSTGDSLQIEQTRVQSDNARNFGQLLQGIIQDYQVAYIRLDRDMEIDKVCDIFTKINSRGLPLGVFDLINALVMPKGVQLKQLARDARTRLAFANSDRMDQYILQVMSILCQEYCSPKYLYNLIPGRQRKVRLQDGSLGAETLVHDSGDFERRWEQAVSALDTTLNLLRHPQEYGVVSSKYLPYTSVLPAFAALQVECDKLPDNQKLSAKEKMRWWYWTSVFTQRYSSAVESTSREDFVALRRWLNNNEIEPPIIGEDRQLDLRHFPGSAVYNGIFNLLVIKGARDWAKDEAPQYGNLDDHHIIPHAWGVAQGLGEEINTILNRTPLTPETNRRIINDCLPNQYLKDMINEHGESRVRSIMASHYISDTAIEILLRCPFTPDDFWEFIAERRKSLSEVIGNLLEWPPPDGLSLQ